MVPSRSHHPFWMYEELVRAPDAVAQVLAPDEIERVHRDAIVARLIAARRVFLTGCGTALHAALAGAALLRDLTDGMVDARAVQAFELANYERGVPAVDDALIVFSHSGKPAATNAALASARKNGAYCVTITGDRESLAARNADAVLDTGYGEVKSFAYTISYSLMLAMMAELAARAARQTGAVEAAASEAQVLRLAEVHRAALDLEGQVRALAERLTARDRFIFAGAGGNYANALEVALKMQETNYSASFGMEMEEVLHGPVAMLGDAVLVVIAPPGAGRTRALDLLRAARILESATVALGEAGDVELEGAADSFLALPACPEPLSVAPYHVPLHLLSYWLAVVKGTNPDLMRREDARYLEARRSYTL
jgi:glutamine---fructose-6-phosphate transaminase (isomerizing)